MVENEFYVGVGVIFRISLCANTDVTWNSMETIKKKPGT